MSLPNINVILSSLDEPMSAIRICVIQLKGIKMGCGYLRQDE